VNRDSDDEHVSWIWEHALLIALGIPAVLFVGLFITATIWVERNSSSYRSSSYVSTDRVALRAVDARVRDVKREIDDVPDFGAAASNAHHFSGCSFDEGPVNPSVTRTWIVPGEAEDAQTVQRKIVDWLAARGWALEHPPSGQVVVTSPSGVAASVGLSWSRGHSTRVVLRAQDRTRPCFVVD
jgi:hypothetical protein